MILFLLLSSVFVNVFLSFALQQEVLLGGHLYLQIIKDKLLNWLTSIQYAVLKKCRDPTSSLQPS